MVHQVFVPKVMSVTVKYLQVKAHVRRWEDSLINGVSDEDGTRTPFAKNEMWTPCIDLDTGTIENWPAGITAKIHFKVCDAGVYELLDEHRNIVVSLDSYVPSILSPGGDGYGDYIIMDVNEKGKISNFVVDLNVFQTSIDDEYDYQ